MLVPVDTTSVEVVVAVGAQERHHVVTEVIEADGADAVRYVAVRQIGLNCLSHRHIHQLSTSTYVYDG